jgi:hypothetical protein
MMGSYVKAMASRQMLDRPLEDLIRAEHIGVKIVGQVDRLGPKRVCWSRPRQDHIANKRVGCSGFDDPKHGKRKLHAFLQGQQREASQLQASQIERRRHGVGNNKVIPRADEGMRAGHGNGSNKRIVRPLRSCQGAFPRGQQTDGDVVSGQAVTATWEASVLEWRRWRKSIGSQRRGRAEAYPYEEESSG